MATQVQKAQAAARSAERRQYAAWQRWQEADSAEDRQAWERAVDEQRAAEAAVDRAEVQQDANEDRQSDWWDAAWSNARAA